tara:strand:+ start:841 stop:990 length:150 start_codon:yes stop_codon:yes gene_type:complete
VIEVPKSIVSSDKQMIQESEDDEDAVMKNESTEEELPNNLLDFSNLIEK